MSSFINMLVRNQIRVQPWHLTADFVANQYSQMIQWLQYFGMPPTEWHDLLLQGYSIQIFGTKLRNISLNNLQNLISNLLGLLQNLAQYYTQCPALERNPQSPELVFGSTQLIRPQNVLVLIIGSAPSPSLLSRGYAFGTFGNASESLLYIYDSLTANVRHPAAEPIGDLEGWISQGVFLINSFLTCGDPDNILASSIVRGLVDADPNIYLMSMGQKARNIVPQDVFGMQNHLDLCHPRTGYHNPEVFEQDYLIGQPFMAANKYLLSNYGVVIDWFGYTQNEIAPHRMDIIKSIIYKNSNNNYQNHNNY